MSEAQFRPLHAIGCSYIKESNPSLSPDALQQAFKVMESFIEGEINYENASKQMERLIRSGRPIEKVNAILQTIDTPPLAVDKEDTSDASFSRKRMHSWSEAEDQRLLSGIHKYGLDNWNAVCAHVGGGRTRAQCAQRWFRGLDPRILKVLWTPEEEMRLVNLVEKYGKRAWTRISAEIGSRSDAQCRYHYNQMIKEAQARQSSRPILSAIASAPPSVLRKAIQQAKQISPVPRVLECSSFITQRSDKEQFPPISELISTLDQSSKALFSNNQNLGINCRMGPILSYPMAPPMEHH